MLALLSQYKLIGSAIVISLIISVVGVLFWSNKQLTHRLETIAEEKTQLELTNAALSQSKSGLEIELNAAYDKQKVISAAMVDLETKLAEIKTLNEEAASDVAKYRKSTAIKCVPSNQWLSIHNKLAASINTASEVMPGSNTAGIKDSDTSTEDRRGH